MTQHARNAETRPHGGDMGGRALATAPVATDVSAEGSLGIAGLEAVYDELAQALDQAGPEKTELFLVKLALLNANALGDPQRFTMHLQAALQDL